MKTRSHSAWFTLIQQQIGNQLSATEFCRQQHLDDKYFSKRKRELHGKRDASLSGNRFIQIQAVHQS